MTALAGAAGVIASRAFETVAFSSPLRAAQKQALWSTRGGAVRLACTDGELAESPAYGCAVVLDGTVFEIGPDGESGAATILRTYLQHGIEAAARIRGEYAFILADDRTDRIIAFVDPVGSRGLAYAVTQKGVLFASRALALLRDPSVGRGWNEEHVVRTVCDVRSGAIGETPFAAVRRIPPGCMVLVELGRLEERQIDRLALGPSDTRARMEDEPAFLGSFWNVLDKAVSRRTGGSRSPCVALSGGLDSTCVAAATLRTHPLLDAISLETLATGLERERIEPFRRERPGLRIRWLAIPTAWAGPGAPENAPLADDPLTHGPAFDGARYALIRAAKEAGHDALLNGDGGDEVFDFGPRLLDMARARAWRDLGRYFSGVHSARQAASIFWRQIAVPLLPRRAFAAWIARERRRVRPVPGYVQDAAAVRAIFSTDALRPARHFEDAVPFALGSAVSAAWNQRQRLWHDALGIDCVSPLLDRDVIEHLARAPTSWRVAPSLSKAFLRRAARDVLPDEARLAPKERDAYDQLALAGLDGPWVARSLVRLNDCPPLLRLVDPELVGTHCEQARTDRRTRDRLYALFAFVEWHARLRDEYGID